MSQITISAYETKMCSMCQKTYSPRRMDQTCCSFKCRHERKLIRERIRQKEIRDSRAVSITFPCMYGKCKTLVTRKGQSANRKYCEVHSKQAISDSRKKSTENRLRKALEKKGNCVHCGTKLAKWKKRFCSTKHRTDYEKNLTRKQAIQKKILSFRLKIESLERELVSCG